MSDPTGRTGNTPRIGRTREGERMSTLIIRYLTGPGKATGGRNFRHGWIVTETSFDWSPSIWSKTVARTV